MGIRRPTADLSGWVFEDFRREVYLAGTQKQWPLHLVVWLPKQAPPNWRALILNRIVSTVGPQLDAGGFFTRPLCVSDPIVFLLWPQDCTWSRVSPLEYLLPLRQRLKEVVFQMVHDGHWMLWPGGDGAPPLAELLPEMRVFRRPPDPSA